MDGAHCIKCHKHTNATEELGDQQQPHIPEKRDMIRNAYHSIVEVSISIHDMLFYENSKLRYNEIQVLCCEIWWLRYNETQMLCCEIWGNISKG